MKLDLRINNSAKDVQKLKESTFKIFEEMLDELLIIKNKDTFNLSEKEAEILGGFSMNDAEIILRHSIHFTDIKMEDIMSFNNFETFLELRRNQGEVTSYGLAKEILDEEKNISLYNENIYVEIQIFDFS